jgi:uncharacterized protein (TIGR00106 family)
MVDKPMIVAEISVVPVGTGSTSLSEYVAAATRALEGIRGLDHDLTPMGTVLQSPDLQPILEAVRVVHDALFEMGLERIVTDLKIDDRRDVERTATRKMESVRNKLIRKR